MVEADGDVIADDAPRAIGEFAQVIPALPDGGAAAGAVVVRGCAFQFDQDQGFVLRSRGEVAERAVGRACAWDGELFRR